MKNFLFCIFCISFFACEYKQKMIGKNDKQDSIYRLVKKIEEDSLVNIDTKGKRRSDKIIMFIDKKEFELIKKFYQTHPIEYIKKADFSIESYQLEISLNRRYGGYVKYLKINAETKTKDSLDISFIEDLKHLEELIIGIPYLKKFPDLSNLKKLKKLYIHTNYPEILFLRHIPNLTSLDITFSEVKQVVLEKNKTWKLEELSLGFPNKNLSVFECDTLQHLKKLKVGHIPLNHTQLNLELFPNLQEFWATEYFGDTATLKQKYPNIKMNFSKF